MEADWASVWVAGGAGIVAVLALGASIWAVLVSRRSADAAERSADSSEKSADYAAKQAVVANRAYRFQAAPVLKLTADVMKLGKGPSRQILVRLNIARSGGPYAMIFRARLNISLVWFNGEPKITYHQTDDNDRSAMAWDDLHFDKRSHAFLHIDNPDDRDVESVLLNASVDMTETAYKPGPHRFYDIDADAIWHQEGTVDWPEDIAALKRRRAGDFS